MPTGSDNGGGDGTDNSNSGDNGYSPSLKDNNMRVTSEAEGMSGYKPKNALDNYNSSIMINIINSFTKFMNYQGGGNDGGNTGADAPFITYERKFEGVNVYSTNISEIGKGAAVTIYPLGIVVSKEGANDIDLLRHEFGHVLQGNMLGSNAYWNIIAPASLFSTGRHKDFWTETNANTLSYYYFNQPTDWNKTRFPLDPILLNKLKQSNLKSSKCK
jgi:hypothetical protein